MGMGMDNWVASCLAAGAMGHWMVVIRFLLEPHYLN
jgi:hypothetical protein